MINKLLLIRKTNSRSTQLDEADVKPFVKGKALNISPSAWHEEAGISHYGFVIGGPDMKLADLEKLQKWAGDQQGITILDHNGNVDDTLSTVGLKINKVA